MGFNEMFSYSRCSYTVSRSEFGFNNIVDIGYNEMFSYPRCSYTGSRGKSGLNNIGGHGFQRDVLIFSL